MFWYFLRIFLIWRLQKVQKALSNEMATRGAESTVGADWSDAYKSWKTNDSKMKALERQKSFFATKKQLKCTLEKSKTERSDRLRAIANGGLSRPIILGLTDEVHIIDQEIKILEKRLNL